MSDVNFEQSFVKDYLNTLQAIISRMAVNSASCKTWCITLVSAIAVIIATQGRPQYIWIALLPIVLFLFLDAYYLALERCFIACYNDFVKKVQEEKASIKDVYVIAPIEGFSKTIYSICKSFTLLSIWPFYGMLLLMLVVTRYIILIVPNCKS